MDGRPPLRIWVVGTSGTGKTTLAARHAPPLDQPHVSHDELWWQPGWRTVGEARMAERVHAATSGARWVIDGNYSRFQAAHVERVELFVWLDYPLATALQRVFWRTLARSVHRVPCCNGNRESLRTAFSSRDSILWWVLTSHGAHRRRLPGFLAPRRAVRLRSPAATARWLRRLPCAGTRTA